MSAKKSPFRPHGRVALLLALVIVLLTVPGLTGLLRGNAKTIREREQREMAAWPSFQVWRENAREYIAACEAWMQDAVGFRFKANAVYRWLRFFLFRQPPMSVLTIGKDGHVFLNSPDPKQPYFFFDNLCLRQVEPSAELFQQMDRTLAAATRVFGRRGAQVIFAIAPTMLALSPDKLPDTLGSPYDKACRAYPGADHLLARLQRQAEVGGQYRLFYPYELFAAHKDEPHFYPKERYHWEGKPAYLFARHLLRESGAMADPPLDDPAEIGQVKDDMATFFGFRRHIDAYIYAYPERPTKLWAEGNIQTRSQKGRVFRSITPNSLTNKTALMINNSFGIALHPHLSKCFRQLFYFDLNFLKEHEQRNAFAALVEQVPADYVFFVVDDMNANRLPMWLNGLVQMDEEASRDSTLEN